MLICWHSSSAASKRRRETIRPSRRREGRIPFYENTGVLKGVSDMEKIATSKSWGFGNVSMVATTVAAVALGAFAIGALAIGELAIRRVSVKNAKLKSLAIEDLTVTRLRVAEVAMSDSLKLPERALGRKLS